MNPFLLLLLPFFTLGQTTNFVQFSVAEGLPQSQVFAIGQDNTGYLWLGTNGGGLSRFDGKHFDVFNTKHGLPSGQVHALMADKKGRLWVCTTQGILWYDGLRFQQVANMNALPKPAMAIFESSDGRVLAGTPKGIYEFNPTYNSFDLAPESKLISNAEVTCFYQSAYGLWVGTNRGAWRLGKEIVKLNQETGLKSAQVSAITGDVAGQIWIGTNRGVASFDESENLLDDTTPLFADIAVSSFMRQSQEELWVGTANEGIVIYNSSTREQRRFRESEGFPHNNIRGIIRDKTGNIWVATSGGGVVKLASQAFSHFDDTDGMLGNRVYAISESRDGKIYFSTSQSGIQYIDSTGVHHLTYNLSDLKVKCKSMDEDGYGRLWVGTEGKGLVLIDSSGEHFINQGTGFPSDWVQKVICTSSGEAWVATFTNGLAKVGFSNGRFSVSKYGKEQGMSDTRLSSMLIDKSGGVWYATLSGELGLIRQGKPISIFGPEHGIPNAQIKTMAFDHKQNLWISVMGQGIYVGNIASASPKFQKVETPKDLFSTNIYLMAFDHNGNLWAGSENGVDELVIDGGKVVALRHHGRDEGFLGIETCHEAVICDKKGNLWFGTINGLTKHHAGSLSQAKNAPSIHLRDITLFYKSITNGEYAEFFDQNAGLKPGLRFRYNQNSLSFSFKAIDLDNPEGVRYRWRLVGFSNDWAPLSSQSQVDYTNLPPGDYVFEAQAISENSPFGEPLRAPFTIRKPFWQMWWFRILMATLIIGGAYAIIKYRLAKIKAQEAEKRRELETLNHLLQLEQKALQLQMNPHFIFNALNSVQALIANEKYLLARQEINSFAKLVRAILTNSRKERITLKEETETLEQYLTIEQFCQKNPFKFELNVDPSIDMDELEIPPMLLQPFVENAVIHGVSHLSYEGQIKIDFKLEGDLMVCHIKDNGVGRVRSAQLQQARRPGHQSTATQVNQERLEALRGGRNFTAFQILDILDGKGEIIGTEVVIRLLVRQL